MADFHILATAQAREGTYQVRLYSVPALLGAEQFPVMMASSNSLPGNPVDHWAYIAQTPPVTLDLGTLQAIGPQQVESETELEQGNPRYASVQIDFLAIPALQIAVAGLRDLTKNIWCEITLFQSVNDAPARPANGSLVWPMKEKLFFWGFIDRMSSKGKVNSQRMSNSFIRTTNVHDGLFSFIFFPWQTWSNFQNVQPLLDFITAQSTVSQSMSAAQMALALMQALAPTPFLLVADQQQLPPQLYESGTRPDIANFDPDHVTWGKMSIRIVPADLTATTMLPEVFFDTGGMALSGHALWAFQESSQTHTLTSDQDASSLYHWNDLAQALTEWTREFFFSWQCELPTLQQCAAAALQGGNATTGNARFLLLDIATSSGNGKPLPLDLDPLEGTIEYNPCGAWAATYTITMPGEDDLLPQPAEIVATSLFVGGSDENYTTLLRFCGYTETGGPPVDSPRGWEIYVKDSHGNLQFAVFGYDLPSTVHWSRWDALHAYKKIGRWGMPRAIVTLTSRGVGLETWGHSASIGSKPIKAPQLTYGLNDFSDFPLGRQTTGLPGILASPSDGQNNNPITFEIISSKRTPNGDSEYKFIEIVGGDQGYSPQPPGSVINTPPPNPPLPPNGGGPPDLGTVGITGL